MDSEEDNLLKVSSDGRKAALDMRLVDPTLFQHGAFKISATADLLASVYEEHKDRIYTDPKTGEPDPVPGPCSWSSATSAHPLTGGTSTASSRTSCAAVAYPSTWSGSSTKPRTTPKRGGFSRPPAPGRSLS